VAVRDVDGHEWQKVQLFNVTIIIQFNSNSLFPQEMDSGYKDANKLLRGRTVLRPFTSAIVLIDSFLFLCLRQAYSRWPSYFSCSVKINKL